MMERELVGDKVKAIISKRRDGTVGLNPNNVISFGASLAEHTVRQIQTN